MGDGCLLLSQLVLQGMVEKWVNVTLCCLAVVLGLWVWFQWRYRKLLAIASGLPSVLPTVSILGHTHWILEGIEGATLRIIDYVKTAASKGYKVTCFWCGPLPFILINDVDDIQLIMNSSNTLDKGEEYNFLKKGLDSGLGPFKNSLPTTPAVIWKTTRRNIASIFTTPNLNSLMPTFNTNARRLIPELREHVGKGRFNISEPILNVSFETLSGLLFGTDVGFDVKSKTFQEFKRVIEIVPELFFNRLISPWLRIDALYTFLYRNELQDINKVWKDFIETPIQLAKRNLNKKRENELKNKSPSDVQYTESAEHEEFLSFIEAYSVLQEKKPQFTDIDMRSELFTFYEIGTDTIALTSSYTLIALAQYPQFQEKLYQEIKSVMGQDNDVTMEHINKMTYLDQVLKETLRKFTVLPFISRKTTIEMKLSSCTLPAGCNVVLSLAAVHLNPTLYPDPDKFDPERFSPELVRQRHKYSFIAFSGGPRECIGKKYAMLLTKVILVHILRNYKVSPAVDTHRLRRKLAVTLISVEGYHVNLELRSQDKSIKTQ